MPEEHLKLGYDRVFLIIFISLTTKRLIIRSHVPMVRTPLWSSGQSSWLDSRRYQIIWEEVGLERGPLSLVSTTEELLGRNSSGAGLENREYGRGDPLLRPRDTHFADKRWSLGRYSSLAD
jgi:hypothetical protein